MPLRTATKNDLSGIETLIQYYAASGDLLAREPEDILKNIGNFFVIEKKQRIIACGSLEHFSTTLAEIRSLVVSPEAQNQGHGKKMVQQLIRLAKQRKVSRLMALTYAPELFHYFDFITVEKDIFPEKVWGICVHCHKFNHCDEIAVLLTL